MQPSATVLNAAASVPTGASEPPLWVIMKALMGGQSVFAGSLCAGVPTINTTDVTAAQGGRFPEGQICLITGSSGLQPVRVLTRVTDTLSFYPNLASIPAVGAVIINLPTWYLTRTNTQSLRLRYAHATDSAYQWEFVGGTGNFELKVARGELAQISVDLSFASYTGPTAQGLSVTHVADTMDDPFTSRSMQAYLQPITTLTRVEYPIESCNVKIVQSNKLQETLSGGTEGYRSVARTENLQEACALIELVLRADSGLETWFTDKEKLTFMLVLQVDTATGRRVFTIDAPRCIIRDVPDVKAGANGLLKATITLECQLDQSASGTLDNEELAQAGIRFACG